MRRFAAADPEWNDLFKMIGLVRVWGTLFSE
jgi:hypothetical protein